MRIRFRNRTAALFVLLATCVIAPHAAAAKSFMWKASKGQGAVYLVGSVHALSQDFYPLAPALEDGFKDSDLLVEEVDLAQMMDPSAQMQIMTRGLLKPDQSLDKILSPSTMALVNKAGSDLGPAMEVLKKFKPWMLAIALQGLELQKAGFDPQLGLDKHFYDEAQAGGKSVQGLETVDYQLSRFDEMTNEQQDHMLAETIKELETEIASVTTLAGAWRTGDAPQVERIVLKDLKSDAQMYQRLLVDRNRNWMPQIEALFARPGRTFVVVGAAHLVGPDGLLQMLRTKGYTIEQL
jgi:uncharacterized protein YbaP (TraB family)